MFLSCLSICVCVCVCMRARRVCVCVVWLADRRSHTCFGRRRRWLTSSQLHRETPDWTPSSGRRRPAAVAVHAVAL